jgi:hypothetical protein
MMAWKQGKSFLAHAMLWHGSERPPVTYGDVFCHAMYLCRMLAMFVTGKRDGGNIKPTEGVHKALGTSMRKLRRKLLLRQIKNKPQFGHSRGIDLSLMVEFNIHKNVITETGSMIRSPTIIS